MSSLARSTSAEVLEALGLYAAESAELLAIATLDRQGAIERANGTLEQLAGRPLAGVSVLELVAPAQRDTLAEALGETGPEWRSRLLGLLPDERGIPLDFRVSLRQLPSGWLLIAEPPMATLSGVNERLLALTDELSHAQRQICHQNVELARQNDRLRELDQLKDVLLANVSHDLRTPLTAILGYAELMRRRGGLPDKHARAAEVIERNARRLLRLVNDLLLLAQARAGQLRLELEPVDLVELAADAFELAQPLAEQGELRFELDRPTAGVAIVEGDRLRLTQLLENVVSNAVKFTPPRGRVVIAVHAHAAAATVEVSDDGPGLDPARQAQLFEPFVRGGSSGAPGTGLGLAIVRAVADAHGAVLAIDSEPGRGTKVSVSLPCPPQP